MFNNQQYKDYYLQNLKRAIKPIDDEINKEKHSNTPNSYKIAKLEESKLLAGLFSDAFGTNERFGNPW